MQWQKRDKTHVDRKERRNFHSMRKRQKLLSSPVESHEGQHWFIYQKIINEVHTKLLENVDKIICHEWSNKNVNCYNFLSYLNTHRS